LHFATFDGVVVLSADYFCRNRAMLTTAHNMMLALYLLLPPLALAVKIYQGRANRVALRRALASCQFVATASLVIGVAASIVYNFWLGGIVSPAQTFLTCYWVCGLLCILRLLDATLNALARWVLLVGFGKILAIERRVAAQSLRAILLFAIGLPYMVAAGATYRPKATTKVDPWWQTIPAQQVNLETADHFQLAAIYLRTAAAPLGNKNKNWGKQTVILCHGPRGGKASYPILANTLLSAGYNVLTFDFRGYGTSDGQLISFGDLERNDVLAAVDWVRSQNPGGSERILGIGVGTGGTALLEAATDPGPDGQAIQSLVVFGGFNTFDSLATSAAYDYFLPPLRWLTLELGVPMASLQTGADLRQFSPASAAEDVSPRPILFISGHRDKFVPFRLGQQLFDAAHAPKSFIVLDNNSEEEVNDANMARAVRQFLDTAVPMI
jgi:fermentation-respiration switch protein FrsA (DUF1100 family)